MAISSGRVVSGAGTGAATGATVGGGWGALIGGVVGGIAGLLSGDGGEEALQQAMQEGIAQLDALGMPPNLSAPIIYQQLRSGGILTPERESQVQEELFNASKVVDNQKTRGQLESALEGIRSKAFGGLSPEQMANQQKLLDQVNAQTQAQMKGILQGQQQRGVTGSGDTLAAMLGAAQGGAQQSSRNALQIGAQNAQAQDTALRDYLQQLGALRSSDTQREQFNASAQQRANEFAAQNAIARQSRNVGASNQAQQWNLTRQNQVNDANTQMANQELLRQREAERQYWQDRMNYINARTGMATGQLQQQVANSNQNWNNITQGIGQMGAAYGQYQNNQANNQFRQQQLDQNQQMIDLYRNRQPANYQTPNDGWSGYTPMNWTSYPDDQIPNR